MTSGSLAATALLSAILFIMLPYWEWLVISSGMQRQAYSIALTRTLGTRISFHAAVNVWQVLCSFRSKKFLQILDGRNHCIEPRRGQNCHHFGTSHLLTGTLAKQRASLRRTLFIFVGLAYFEISLVQQSFSYVWKVCLTVLVYHAPSTRDWSVLGWLSPCGVTRTLFRLAGFGRFQRKSSTCQQWVHFLG